MTGILSQKLLRVFNKDKVKKCHRGTGKYLKLKLKYCKVNKNGVIPESFLLTPQDELTEIFTYPPFQVCRPGHKRHHIL
jgi:hypothetical protein